MGNGKDGKGTAEMTPRPSFPRRREPRSQPRCNCQPPLDSRLRGNDEEKITGMTGEG